MSRINRALRNLFLAGPTTSGNLLVNPDFEAGICRDTLFWTPQGGPLSAEFGNIDVPAGWVAWWDQDMVNSGSPTDQPNGKPEIHVLSLAAGFPDANRILSGDKSLQIFCFWRNIRAGLMQQVRVPLGARLRFTAHAHAWYSDCDVRPHDPPLLEDCSTPATQSHLYLRLGIDPFGGMDPHWSGKFLWSEGNAGLSGDEQYGAFGAALCIEATAEAETITVALRANSNHALKHVDTYWDNLCLEVIPGRPRGAPRVQYARVVNVLPATATEEQAVEVFRQGWRRGRETTGGSYDDAGIGDLNDRTAHLYGISSNQEDTYVQWFNTEYPGVELDFAPLPGSQPPPPPPPPPPPFELKLSYPTTHLPPAITQPFGGAHGGIDLRASFAVWGDHILAAYEATVIEAGYSDTFGNYVLTTTVLPDGSRMDLRYAHMLEDLAVERYAHVIPGQVLGMAGSTGTSTGDHLHFSVHLAGTYVDPAPLIDWPSDPPPPQPGPSGGAPIAFHGQTWSPWMHAFNALVHQRSSKGLASIQDGYSVLLANPACTWVWRCYDEQHSSMQGTPEAGSAVWISKWIDGVRQACDEMEQRNIAPTRGRPYFLVESLNEVYACFDPRLPWVVEFDRAFLRQLREAEPRVGAVVFCAPVGNPHETEFAQLIPLAQDVSDAGAFAAMGYHAYWAGDSSQSYLTREHWPYLAGRWAEMDRVFRSAGAYPRWFFGECGVVGGHPVAPLSLKSPAPAQWTYNRTSPAIIPAEWTQDLLSHEGDEYARPISADPWKYAPAHYVPGPGASPLPAGEGPGVRAATGGGYYLNPGSGWLDGADCYGGNWQRYFEDIQRFCTFCDETPAGQDDLVLGGALFTTGAPYTGWAHFQMHEPQFTALAPWLRNRYPW